MIVALPPKVFPAVPLRFIIADDELSICRIIARAIPKIFPGSVSTIVHNGQEALSLYAQDGADCIVTDRHMPIMDGLLLIAAIRAQANALPILLVSANPDEATRGATVGRTHFLVKPFTLNQLATALTLLLPALFNESLD